MKRDTLESEYVNKRIEHLERENARLQAQEANTRMALCRLKARNETLAESMTAFSEAIRQHCIRLRDVPKELEELVRDQ